MILMLIDFGSDDLRAFWGETPQACWIQFIKEHGGDFDHEELENMAFAAEFYKSSELGVMRTVERKITFS